MYAIVFGSQNRNIRKLGQQITTVHVFYTIADIVIIKLSLTVLFNVNISSAIILIEFN